MTLLLRLFSWFDGIQLFVFSECNCCVRWMRTIGSREYLSSLGSREGNCHVSETEIPRLQRVQLPGITEGAIASFSKESILFLVNSSLWVRLATWARLGGAWSRCSSSAHVLKLGGGARARGRYRWPLLTWHDLASGLFECVLRPSAWNSATQLPPSSSILVISSFQYDLLLVPKRSTTHVSCMIVFIGC